MYFIFKKRSVRKFVLLFVAFCVLLLCGVFREKKELSEPASALPATNRVVVIDAGHGGFDAGASANGVREKDVNLDVALRLREYLEQNGSVVFLTREEDLSTAEENMEGKSAKKSDLAERKSLADRSEADIFVSIHMNKFPQTQYRGAQVFYDSSKEGKRLGEEIQGALKEVLQDQNERVAKKIDGGVFILKNTTVPSVIVECGFLSNPEEAKLLLEDGYRQKLAWGIYMGITRYFL